MSLARNLFPLATCTAIGIGSGIYIFKPALQQDAEEKNHTFSAQHSSTSSSNPSKPTTSSPSSTLPKDLPSTPLTVLPTSTSPTSPNSQTAASSSPAAVSLSTPPFTEDNLIKTEVQVANAGGATRIPREADRWGEVQVGQYGRVAEGFEWSQEYERQEGNGG